MVTKRGTKHLKELVDMVKNGHRAVMFFLVSRTDATHMVPAEHIDPVYAETLRWAAQNGVEIMAYGTDLDAKGVHVSRPIAVDLSPSA